MKNKNIGAYLSHTVSRLVAADLPDLTQVIIVLWNASREFKTYHSWHHRGRYYASRRNRLIFLMSCLALPGMIEIRFFLSNMALPNNTRINISDLLKCHVFIQFQENFELSFSHPNCWHHCDINLHVNIICILITQWYMII